MDNNKALSPNSYNAFFLKKAWNMGEDITNVIKHFFNSSHLLKEVNCTIHALVPKVSNLSYCKDFNLIACYNTIYKCITKILDNRLKEILPLCISKSQSVFMGSRNIGDNILLCQGLRHNYH